MLLPPPSNAQQSSLASYSGPESSIRQFLCTPKTAENPNGQNLFECINKIYRFAIAFGSVAAVFLIVIAGYVYMSSEGNQESVDKAKSIVTSCIVALVILMGGYVLLKAINPDLIQFHDIQVTGQIAPFSTPSASNCQGTGCNLTISDSAKQAQQLLNLNGSSITIVGSGSCSGNNPLANIKAITGGSQAVFDGPGSLCNKGQTTIDAGMLSALVNVANAGLKITITSITSGHHSSANDPHYAGRAVDLVPQNLKQDGQSILNTLVQGGAAKVAVECNLGGKAQFIVIYPSGGSSVNASSCTGQPNYHWHAQWGGTSGNLTPENN